MGARVQVLLLKQQGRFLESLWARRRNGPPTGELSDARQEEWEDALARLS